MGEGFQLLSLIYSLFLLFEYGYAGPLVPSIYVFGDSEVDSGNNNVLRTPAKADKLPYGIDLNNVTGRFTNGKNIADITAELLGLPMPPPYMNISESQRIHTITGINYGSGSCGILNTTGAGECLTLGKQVELFTKTATVDLPKAIYSRRRLRRHLANSIYFIIAGSNDYNQFVNNGERTKFTPQDYAQRLEDEMANQLKKLYDLGARKFLVDSLATCKPNIYVPERCEPNYYADKITEKLKELQATLYGSSFTAFYGRDIITEIRVNAANYGIKVVDVPCFTGSTLCPNRSDHFVFDIYGHPTETVYKLIATDCFNGTSCLPLSVSQLATVPSH